MRLNSILMFVLALLFGVAAVVLARVWLEGQRSFAAKPDPVQLETIVVATKPLRFGTELMKEHLKEISWPEGAKPSGAFRNISDILDHKKGRRAVLSPIEANEPILSWKITGPGERATLSAVVAEGMRAISIKINDVLGVAGFVLPGDRVDIMLTRKGEGGSYTDLLLQSVKILAIDQLADERADKPDVAKTVTIEVDTEDAQKLTLAQTVGTLSLALRKAGHTTAALPRRVTLGDLGPGMGYANDGQPKAEPAAATSDQKQAEAPAVEIKGSGSAQPTTADVKPAKPSLIDPNARIGVIRGMQLQEYRVPKDQLPEIAE